MATISGTTLPLNGQGALTAICTQRTYPQASLRGTGALTGAVYRPRANRGGLVKDVVGPFGLLAEPPVPVVPSAGGSSWEVQVRAAPDFSQLLCVVPRYTSLTFTKQLKDKGSGSITLDLDDDGFWDSTLGNGQPATTLLDGEHLWQVYQDGVLRFEWFAETVTEELLADTEQRAVTITGPGTIAALAWGAAMPPGFPKIVFKTDAIQDGFAEIDDKGNPALDTNIWNLVYPANHVTLNPSGSLQLTGSPSTTFCGAYPYDITSSSISAQVSPILDEGLAQGGAATLNGTQVSQFYIQHPTITGNYALMGLSRALFYCQVGDSGHVASHQLNAYDASAHAYWRISEKNGTFFFFTSADGSSWVQQWKCDYGWTASKIDVYFSARYSIDNSQVMRVTNLNGDVITPTSAGNTYFGEPILAVWYDIFTAAQKRGTIPYVTTRLNGDHDSFGHPWTDSNSVQIQNGTDLFSLLQSHAAIVNADWVMQPGFVLQVGLQTNDGSGIGKDRSQSLVLRETLNELTKQRVRARDKIANLIGGVNSDGTVIVDSDPSSISTWGQREGWVQTANQVNPASMAGATAASLAETKDEVLSWTMTVDPAQVRPFIDFDVGDWVGAEKPGNTSTIESVRVVAIAVAIDATGLVTCEPTLNSYRQWMQEQLAYIVQKLGGGFINSLGTTPVTSSAISPQGLPTVMAPSLGGLSDVNTGTINMDPLVYNSLTGMWQPASLVNKITGQPLGLTVGTPGGSSIALSPSGGAVNIVITDNTGNVRVISGLQPDGSYAHAVYNAGPPGQPSMPIVTPGILGLYVSWDGMMSDGTAPLADYAYTEVHVSDSGGFVPSAGTLKGHVGPGGIFGVGGLTAGTSYYTKLLAVNSSGIAGTASAQVIGVPTAVPDNIPTGSITGQQVQTGTLTGANLSANAGIIASQLAENAGIKAGQVVFSATDIGGVSATFSSAPPQSPGPNTLWYDAANGYALKTWNGSTWVKAQFGVDAVSFKASDIGGITVAFGGTPPANPGTGAIWYDATNGYVMKQWTGSSWVPYQLGAGAVSFKASEIGGTTVSISSSQPTSPATGDLWYDANNGYQLKRWSGGSWVAYQYGTSAIAAGSITAALIAANTITAAQIAAGTITTSEIAAGTILAADIAAGTITGTQIAAGTITGDKISADTITGNLIAASTITGTEIAAGTITGDLIAGATITGELIAANTISTSLLAAGIVVAGIVDGTIVTGATVIADGVAGQLLVYNGPPDQGNLIFSVSGQDGYDNYGNFYPMGMGLNQGTITGVGIQNAGLTGGTIDSGSIGQSTISSSTISGGTITETTISFDTAGGALLMYASTSSSTTQTASGSYTMTVAAGTDTVDVTCTGAGAGGDGGSTSVGGHGGGGGECARNPSYAVTAGQEIDYVVGNGGASSGTGAGNGDDGGDTYFDNQNVGVYAHGGNGSGAGGTGSHDPVHNDGGDGGTASSTGGAGGGGSGGTSGAGGNGSNNSGTGSAGGGAAGSGGGAAGGAGGANAANGSAGSAPGGGGGGAGCGSGSTAFNKTYTATHTYSYEGSDGHQPNAKINTDGTAYQGGDYANTYNGKCKTWIRFAYNTIHDDLQGVVLSSTRLKLNNNHSWYFSGMTIAVGWDTKDTFGSTASNPSGGNIDVVNQHVDEGATITFGVSGLGQAFRDGSAHNVVLFRNTNSLSYYGYFAGAGQSGPPQLIISGTVGGTPTTSGAGQDGKIVITGQGSATLVGSVAPVAGTDAYANDYPAGFMWQGVSLAGAQIAAYPSGRYNLARQDTTTKSADPNLTLPVEANSVYQVECMLVYTGGAACSTGLRWNWVGPSGAEWEFGNHYLNTNNVWTFSYRDDSQGDQGAYTDGTAGGNQKVLYITGTLYTGASAGDFTLWWALWTVSSGITTRIWSGSYLALTKQ